MYQIRRLSRERDKCALYRWDERYRAHTRLVTQGTEAERKERGEE